MDHLTERSVADLQRALDEVEDKRAALRLVAAIAYKHGVTQTELAAWFGVERKTIYNWLTRLESGPLPDAAVDAPRPGRPAKLSAGQQAALFRSLRDAPSAAGYDAAEWSPELVQAHVREAFGVSYSLASCRRLLARASGRGRRS